jgi:hypothetical protein
MESRMEKLMSVVEGIMDRQVPRQDQEDEEWNAEVMDELVCTDQEAETNHSNRLGSLASSVSGSRSSDGSRLSGSSSGTSSSMDAESTGNIQSPEHKRQRSSRKKNSRKLPESIRRHLDRHSFSSLQSNNDSATNPSNSSAETAFGLHPSPPQSPTGITNNDEDDRLLTPRSPTPPPDTTDPESQYKEKSLPSTDSEHLPPTGATSHRRGSHD